MSDEIRILGPDGTPYVPKPTLADVVAAQVAALTADFAGESRSELPGPDPHTYTDALASARSRYPLTDMRRRGVGSRP